MHDGAKAETLFQPTAAARAHDSARDTHQVSLRAFLCFHIAHTTRVMCAPRQHVKMLAHKHCTAQQAVTASVNTTRVLLSHGAQFVVGTILRPGFDSDSDSNGAGTVCEHTLRRVTCARHASASARMCASRRTIMLRADASHRAPR